MFKKIKVLTFSNRNFINSETKLIAHLNNIGVYNIIRLNENDLTNEFKLKYQNILQNKRGFGYWIWKPFIILNELKKLGDDEILYYIDSTDVPELSLFQFILDHFKTNTYLFFNRGYNHGEWTKRDTFVLMNCDRPEYYNSVQLEAGDMCLINNEFNIRLIEEWFSYCTNINILTDIPNICGLPNLPTFKDHRHDQSILTNIIIKNNIVSYNFDTNKIKYNYNQPLIY